MLLLTSPLQSILHATVKLTHVILLSKQLWWFPITSRIKYKVLYKRATFLVCLPLTPVYSAIQQHWLLCCSLNKTIHFPSMEVVPHAWNSPSPHLLLVQSKIPFTFLDFIRKIQLFLIPLNSSTFSWLSPVYPIYILFIIFSCCLPSLKRQLLESRDYLLSLTVSPAPSSVPSTLWVFNIQ